MSLSQLWDVFTLLDNLCKSCQGSVNKQVGIFTTCNWFNIKITQDRNHVRIQRGLPPGKSKSYMVPWQKSQSYQASVQCWAIIGRQWNTIYMAFHWCANDGLPLVFFVSSLLPSSTYKNMSVRPPLTKLTRSMHGNTWHLPSGSVVGCQLEIKGSLVRDSPKAMCCILEHDTLSSG